MIFCCACGSGTAAFDKGKHVDQVEEDVDIEEDSSDEVFIPEWSVTRGARLRDAAICREVMVHFVPPAEERFLNLHDDDEAARRG